MKLNEVLIIAGSLLAALVLSKGGSVSSIFKKPSVSVLPLENSNQNKIFDFGETFFNYETKIKTVIVKPPEFTKVDITDQLRNVSNYELQQNITPYQTEINKAENYITNQNNPYSENPDFSKIAPKNWNGISLLRKFDRDSDPYRSLFPDFKLLYTQENRDIIADQARFENAENVINTNIGKANEFVKRQQGEIDLINEEYQTRFGGLSRYG